MAIGVNNKSSLAEHRSRPAGEGVVCYQTGKLFIPKPGADSHFLPPSPLVCVCVCVCVCVRVCVCVCARSRVRMSV